MASAIKLLADRMVEMEKSFLAIFFEAANKIATSTESKLFFMMESSDGIRTIGGNPELLALFHIGALLPKNTDVTLEDGLPPEPSETHPRNIHVGIVDQVRKRKKTSCDLSEAPFRKHRKRREDVCVKLEGGMSEDDKEGQEPENEQFGLLDDFVDSASHCDDEDDELNIDSRPIVEDNELNTDSRFIVESKGVGSKWEKLRGQKPLTLPDEYPQPSLDTSELGAEPTFITSGKGSFRMLINGYHMSLNKPPRGDNLTAYFRCVVQTCPARAATHGDLHQDSVQLKYHNKYPYKHNHPPDEVGNLLAKHSYDFRKCARDDSVAGAKSCYDKLVEATLDTLPSDLKEAFLQRLPPFSSSKMQFYRAQKKSKESINSQLNGST